LRHTHNPCEVSGQVFHCCIGSVPIEIWEILL
jgi:hypothetical protein